MSAWTHETLFHILAVIQSHFILLLLDCVGWLLCSLAPPRPTTTSAVAVCFVKHVLCSWYYQILQIGLVYSCPHPRISHVFIWRLVLETKIWVLRVFIASGVLRFYSFSVDKTQKYVYVY